MDFSRRIHNKQRRTWLYFKFLGNMTTELIKLNSIKVVTPPLPQRIIWKLHNAYDSFEASIPDRDFSVYFARATSLSIERRSWLYLMPEDGEPECLAEAFLPAATRFVYQDVCIDRQASPRPMDRWRISKQYRTINRLKVDNKKKNELPHRKQVKQGMQTTGSRQR